MSVTRMPERRIEETPLSCALHAIHWIVLAARREVLDWTHGRKPTDAGRMVDLLDAAEGLTDILKQDQSEVPESFWIMLKAIGQDFPEFAGLVDNALGRDGYSSPTHEFTNGVS